MASNRATPSDDVISQAYKQLIDLVEKTHLLSSTASLLGWDQETMMPPKGLDYRSRQLAQLARLVHQMSTDTRIGDLLAECEADHHLIADPLSVPAVNIREIRREYDRATKLPVSLVEQIAQTSSVARAHWAEARHNSDFKAFQPWLEQIVGLVRDRARCLGWDDDGEPWDALADDFEPGCTARQIEDLFAALRERLVGLVGQLMESQSKPSNVFDAVALPVDRQKTFVRDVAARLGFDFERGRLDVSTHPFCGGTHCHDVRMTTRFSECDLPEALGSTMHESGHGLYGQSLPDQHIGTPMGSSISLGIHESQSRLWENHVGRSRAFWHWCLPKMHERFGAAVADLNLEIAYASANVVKPDYIRVEADEATYNLHVMVRFEIERALVADDLAVADVPAAWKQKYREYLGIDVPDDRRGCLQDVHWSQCGVGYFPTYTLGNLYAAQFFEQAQQEIGDLDGQFGAGEFGPLRQWLNEKIHSQGKRYRAADLCQHLTGKPLSAEPLMRHLENKLRPLYGLD